jgi:hypothetical protein
VHEPKPRWVLHRAVAPTPARRAHPIHTISGHVSWGYGASERPRAADIKRVIADHRRAIRCCYESALVTRPGLEGRVVLRFVIGESGAVTEADVVENELDADVGDCVVGRVAMMPFPSPGPAAMAVVNYPFVFRHAP